MKAYGTIFPNPLLERRHTMNHAHNSLTKSLRSTNTSSSNCCFNADMKRRLFGQTLIVGSAFLCSATLILAAPAPKEPPVSKAPGGVAPTSNLTFHQVSYEAKITDDEARFVVTIDAES